MHTCHTAAPRVHGMARACNTPVRVREGVFHRTLATRGTPTPIWYNATHTRARGHDLRVVTREHAVMWQSRAPCTHGACTHQGRT